MVVSFSKTKIGDSFGAMQKVCHSEKSKFHTPSPPKRVTNGSFVTAKWQVFRPLPLWQVTYFLHRPFPNKPLT